jgi:hypothetical protein
VAKAVHPVIAWGLIIGVVWWVGSLSCPNRSPPPGGSPGAPSRGGGVDIPFVSALAGYCRAYDGAPNQIKKSAVFREAQGVLQGERIRGVQGTLRTMSTNQGGSEVDLTVRVSTTQGDVDFTTESLMEGIRKGSRVYNQAAEMREGECVVISADRVRSAAVFEREQVCDKDFFVRFTDVQTCAAAAAVKAPAPPPPAQRPRPKAAPKPAKVKPFDPYDPPVEESPYP